MKIVFMGTPDFAVPSLDILHRNGYDIVGVITAPDRKAGRGQQVRQSAVKRYAVQHGMTVLQPVNLKSPEFQKELKALEADLQVVVAFRMLPVAVWDMPPMGTMNLHASLLPAYRGAAPINWAVINGESQSGVTTFLLKHEIDTGDLLLQKEVAIGPEETAGELHDKLMQAGAELVLRSVRGLESGELAAVPQQSAEGLPRAPKIHREDCEINWNRGAESVNDLIRGLSPYPAAFTELHGKQLKIFRAGYTVDDHDEAPGDPETDGEGLLRFYTPDGWVDLKEVQLEGKKRMSTEEFLRGYRWPE